jgi:hypothetical protein
MAKQTGKDFVARLKRDAAKMKRDPGSVRQTVVVRGLCVLRADGTLMETAYGPWFMTPGDRALADRLAAPGGKVCEATLHVVVAPASPAKAKGARRK